MTQSIRTRLCFEKLEAREVHAFLTPVASPIDFDKTGDFNGDGRADLISVDSATSKLTVRLGNGDGTFATAKTTTLSGTPNIRAVADLNADGKDDVVLTLGGSEMALMLSNGNGTFTKSSSSPVLAKVTVPGNNKPQTQRASSIVVGDLNGDSLLDLAVIGNWATTSNGVISGSAAYLNVFYAKGVGGFTAKPPVFLMSGPRMYAVNPEVHLADLAGDGRPEVLAVDSHLGTKVLTAQPDGSFQLTKSTSQFNGGPVTVADFNGDGKDDVVGWQSGGSTVNLFLGAGDGSFGAAQTFATGAGLGKATVADVNNDGKADLVTANSQTSGSDSVSVLMGNGDGTFQTARTFAVGAELISIALADFDGDGRIDLARREWNGIAYQTVVLFNDGVW